MRLLPLTFLLLLLSSHVSAQTNHPSEKELSRFKTLARTIAGSVPSEHPDPKLSEAMDILIRAAWQIKHTEPSITDEQLQKRMTNFFLAANPKKEDTFPTAPSHFELTTAHTGNRTAITVTYGPISRLAVFDSLMGRSIPVAKPMTWLYPWHQEPIFLNDGSLLVLSESVQDMGNRIGRRVDTLVEQSGKWQHLRSLIRQSCLELEPSIKAEGPKLTIQSLDNFHSFFVAAAEPAARRTETFLIKNGSLHLIKTVMHDQLLRAADEYMTQARKTRTPNSYQRIIRDNFGDPEMLMNHEEKQNTQGSSTLILEFDAITLHFTFTQQNGKWQMHSLTAIKRTP